MLIIIANILSFLSNLGWILSSCFKKKHSMLVLQIFECLCGAFAEVLVGGFAAASTLLLACLRNIINAKEGIKHLKLIGWLLSLAVLIIGICVNPNGFIGLLPVFANIQYTLWVAYSNTAQQLRVGMLINCIPWLIHEFFMGLYVSVIFLIVTTIVIVINIIRYREVKEDIK